jgi:hypothetical protein
LLFAVVVVVVDAAVVVVVAVELGGSPCARPSIVLFLRAIRGYRVDLLRCTGGCC